MTFKLEVAIAEPDFRFMYTNPPYLVVNGVRIDPSVVGERTPVEPGTPIGYHAPIENEGGVGTATIWLMESADGWNFSAVSGSSASKEIAAGATDLIEKSDAATMPDTDRDYKIWLGWGTIKHDELGCGELESEEGKFGL